MDSRLRNPRPAHRVAPLSFKPHRLEGLSDRLLVSHYENNYGGAVRRLNAIEGELERIDPATAPGFVLNGLQREALIAANSMILHEIYFDGLGGTGDPVGELAGALERDFGSVAAWRAEFAGMGKALAGGSGWVLLARSCRDGRLRNHWAADHAHGPADARVVLALDMYEHSYHLDFGAKAGAYVDAIMRNLAWDRIQARFDAADGASAAAATVGDGLPEVAPEDLRAAVEAGDALVLNVCLREDLAKVTDAIPGALYRDPEQVAAWVDAVPRDRPVVAYCMYGFWVSSENVAALRKAGVDARTLTGGIAAWRASGGPTVPAA